MASTSIDYITIYFQYKALTKIHGAPTYETLREMKDQLKANAASVNTNLGGGANGHLGIVLTPTEYRNISDTTYTRPNHPGRAVIPAGTTNHETSRINRQRSNRRETGTNQANCGSH